nr:hypothetical protein BaRGS_034995 [Batillaria attramentaria]
MDNSYKFGTVEVTCEGYDYPDDPYVLKGSCGGFRNDRSCTDHIATMRIIIEQSLEWQTPLYSTFVDFQKAFDSVDREVIWKLMSHYGFPPKFVNIIRQLYEDATCQVIHDGKLT